MQRFETNAGSLTVAVQSEVIVMVMSASKSPLTPLLYGQGSRVTNVPETWVTGFMYLW